MAYSIQHTVEQIFNIGDLQGLIKGKLLFARRMIGSMRMLFTIAVQKDKLDSQSSHDCLETGTGFTLFCLISNIRK